MRNTQQFAYWNYLKTCTAHGTVAYSWQLADKPDCNAIATCLLTSYACNELDAACVFLFGTSVLDESIGSGRRLYDRDVLALDVNRPRLVQRAIACAIARAAIQLALESARMFPASNKAEA